MKEISIRIQLYPQLCKWWNQWIISSLEKAKRKYTIYFYQAIRNIAFVCVIREENFDKMGLIRYNLDLVSNCLKELFGEQE